MVLGCCCSACLAFRFACDCGLFGGFWYLPDYCVLGWWCDCYNIGFVWDAWFDGFEVYLLLLGWVCLGAVGGVVLLVVGVLCCLGFGVWLWVW